MIEYYITLQVRSVGVYRVSGTVPVRDEVDCGIISCKPGKHLLNELRTIFCIIFSSFMLFVIVIFLRKNAFGNIDNHIHDILKH